MGRQRPAKTPSSKRNGHLTVAEISALDLENVAQVELRDYFEMPQESRRGTTPVARPATDPQTRACLLFELERLIRRARRDAARTAAIQARAREENRLRGLGDWDVSREAMERLRNKLAEFDLRRPIASRRKGSVNPVRESWRLWEGVKAPARESIARRGHGASRRDLHLEILSRHRQVQRRIRGLVARLQPRARPEGRMFRLAYLPGEHRLQLIVIDPEPGA